MSGRDIGAAAREERQERVAELLLQGLPQRGIAERLEMTKSTVNNDVQVIRSRWRERAAESYEQQVAEEVAKLDLIERVFWPKAVDGSLSALDRLLRVMERRAKLLGLDRPTRTEMTVNRQGTPTLDAEIELLLDQFHGRG